MAVLSARSIEYNRFTLLFFAESIIFVKMVPNPFELIGDGARNPVATRVGSPAHAGERPMGYQRLAMYIVISMPNRYSTACGVSHFMTNLLGCNSG